MSLIHNEQVKLMANAIDRASTAALNAGVILPLAALTLLPSHFNVADVFAAIYIWAALAYVLHLAARRTLRRLK